MNGLSSNPTVPQGTLEKPVIPRIATEHLNETHTTNLESGEVSPNSTSPKNLSSTDKPKLSPSQQRINLVFVPNEVFPRNVPKSDPKKDELSSSSKSESQSTLSPSLKKRDIRIRNSGDFPKISSSQETISRETSGSQETSQ